MAKIHFRRPSGGSYWFHFVGICKLIRSDSSNLDCSKSSEVILRSRRFALLVLGTLKTTEARKG